MHKLLFYSIIFIFICIILFVYFHSETNSYISKFISFFKNNDEDKKQLDILFNNIFKANIGNNKEFIKEKKDALFNNEFCNGDFNNNCEEIKQIIMDDNSNSANFQIKKEIRISNEKIAEETMVKLENISGCSMLMNHILFRQNKDAWNDVSKILDEIKDGVKGLNIFLTCQILKLVTFYSDSQSNAVKYQNWNIFDWGTIKTLNWYKSCKGTSFQITKIIFYAISLFSSIYIYSYWLIWLFKTPNNFLFRFNFINNTTTSIRKLGILFISLIIIFIILIPYWVGNNKMKIEGVIGIVVYILMCTLLLFVPLSMNTKIKYIYLFCSFSLFIYYVVHSRLSFEEKNCNKDECNISSEPEEVKKGRVCVSKLNNKDYGGITFNEKNGQNNSQ